MDAASVPVPASSLPEGWVDHPRIPITRRAVWMGVAVFLAAVLMAAGSIYFRRTQLELTTRFWGVDTIRAMQLAPIVTLVLVSDGNEKVINLNGTPGLGHLRHALLEQKHYLWETEVAQSIESIATGDPKFATLTFSDPRAPEDGGIAAGVICLELTDGWVGKADGSKSVRLAERVKPAVRHFLTILGNAQQSRSDFRND